VLTPSCYDRGARRIQPAGGGSTADSHIVGTRLVRRRPPPAPCSREARCHPL